eukprot:g24031.t1
MVVNMSKHLKAQNYVALTFVLQERALVERRTEDEKLQAQQIREVIREEMSAATANQSAAARPMQFIINNTAQAHVEQPAPVATPPPPPPPEKPATMVEAFFRFMDSPLHLPWRRRLDDPCSSAVRLPPDRTVHIQVMTYRLEVHCDQTGVGDQVAITGAGSDLGNWDTSKAVRLETFPETFPVWEVPVSAAILLCEFKCIIFRSSGEVTWEAIPNRCWKGRTSMQPYGSVLRTSFDLDELQIRPPAA